LVWREYGIDRKTLNGASFIAYGISLQHSNPAKSINKASYAVKRGNAAAERVLKFDQQTQLHQKWMVNKTVLNRRYLLKYQLQIRRECFKRLFVEVKKGQTIALGATGSGKVPLPTY
jgi:subfamily B ATP-binding cassette protein MsbA